MRLNVSFDQRLRTSSTVSPVMRATSSWLMPAAMRFRAIATALFRSPACMPSAFPSSLPSTLPSSRPRSNPSASPVAIVGNTLRVDRSIYEILQILSFSLLDKTPINEILTNADYNIDNELSYKQLKINWE